MRKITIAKIKVTMRLNNDPDSSQKAVVTLVLGPFKIKGIRILESEYENKRGEKLWVAPPSYRSKSGKFHPTFFCENKEIWEEIEDEIFKEYRRRIEDEPPKFS